MSGNVLILLLWACATEPPPPTSPDPGPTSPPPAEARAATAIRASGGSVRAVPPGSPSSAAFVELRNDADRDVALVGATSPVARSVELHTHVDADGMMQMRRVDRFSIPAGGVLRLGSGGPHIMLIGLVQDLVPGATVPLTLRFDDGSELALELPVQPPGAATHPSTPQADAPH